MILDLIFFLASYLNAITKILFGFDTIEIVQIGLGLS